MLQVTTSKFEHTIFSLKCANTGGFHVKYHADPKAQPLKKTCRKQICSNIKGSKSQQVEQTSIQTRFEYNLNLHGITVVKRNQKQFNSLA